MSRRKLTLTRARTTNLSRRAAGKMFRRKQIFTARLFALAVAGCCLSLVLKLMRETPVMWYDTIRYEMVYMCAEKLTEGPA